MTDYAEHTHRMRVLVQAVSHAARNRRYEDAFNALREIEGCCCLIRHALDQLRTREGAKE